MSKYHAVPRVVDNIRFASTKEARRYQELKLLLAAGAIAALELQPRFALHACRGTRRQLIGVYVADFRYVEPPSTVPVVEDVKGMDTPLSKWKRKHVLAQYGVEVRLT